VAVARAGCLYCGAALPEGAVAAARAASEAVVASPTPAVADLTGALIVLDLSAADPARVAEALGISTYEAQLRVRRGGYQLHRIAPAEQAARELEELRARGVAASKVAETEARAGARVLACSGGSREAEGALSLRTSEGPLRLETRDLLLVVRGPITREYAPLASNDPRRLRTASLDPGYRVHLHRRAEPRPVELDPGSFAFRDARGADSSLLQLEGWVDAIARGVPIDDGFRRLAPALSPSVAEEAGPAAGVFAAAGRKGGGRKGGASVVLDNLPQFRFYSGWRSAVERLRGAGEG
jgi:hypothetical protein